MMIFLSFGIGLLLTFLTIYLVRNIYQLPYPAEGVFRNPDANGVIESFRLTREGTTLKWVMGTFNHKIFCDPRVKDAIDEFLEREIQWDIIVGPNINSESKSLIMNLVDRDNVIIQQLPYNPKRHFRIISNEHLSFEPREHEENELSHYILMKKAKALLKQYEGYFKKYKEDSKILIITEEDRISHERKGDN